MAAHESLAGGQFRVLKDPYVDLEQYDYVKPDRYGDIQNHLTMSVQHYKPQDKFAYPEGTPNERQHLSMMDHPATQQLEQSEAEGAPRLFGYDRVEGHSTVNYLQGTKEARIQAGTMMGIAQNRNITQRGRSLTASDDLSQHSDRVVNHLARKGVTGASGGVTNHLDFVQAHAYETYGVESHAIPEAEVAQGRRTMRRVLKGGALDPRGSASLPAPSGPRKQGPEDPNQGRLF